MTKQRLHPAVDTGLTPEEVVRRTAQGLTNTQPEPITKSTWEIIRDNTFTLFNLFNLAIAVALILVGAYKNVLFFGVIFLNVLIGIAQELRSKKMVEKLSLIALPKANVIRGGVEKRIPVEELVLDDIIFLEAGAQVSADATVRDGTVEVNESLLTGESEPVVKGEGELLLSGSFIVSGSCHAQVEHIGADNFATKIVLAAKKYKKSHSGLMEDLNRIVKFTGFFIIPFGLLLVVHSVFALRLSLYDTVVSVSAALLGMLPKGLVLLTTLSLVVGVIKLAQKKTLVQELFCIETLSRVDTICLDKTGTLTTGTMQVHKLIELDGDYLSVPLAALVADFTAALPDKNGTAEALRAGFTHPAGLTPVDTVPFSSARKWSAVTFKEVGTVFVGAPDILLKNQNYTLPDQVTEEMDSGRRTVLVAVGGEPVDGALPKVVYPVAAVVLEDAIRYNAGEILDFFRKEGVDIKIISGDHPATVMSIAAQAGVTGITAVDASTLKTDEELEAAALTCSVFGRVLPAQKKQLVNALQKHGHVVAMTGDGVNDVLALKDANCSIAMASGSDAAKQVSQLVLLDSDFASLPSVVMEGRRVINNITRTASLFLVKTIFSFLLSFLTVFCGIPYPFMPLHLTLISMFVEGIPSFLLAFEPSKERIRGDFLYTVLTRAFPSAVIIVLYILAVNLWVGPMLALSALETTTLSLYLMGFAWLMQLFRVCLPFNTMRKVLFFSMFALFYACAYFLRGLFSLGTLSLPGLIAFLAMSALCWPFQNLLYGAAKKLGDRFLKHRLHKKNRGENVK